MKKTFRFLHISDLHLSTIHPLCPVTLSNNKSDIFYKLSLQALEKAVELVNTEKLDALLIAGDLLEAGSIDYRLINDVFEILSTSRAPVFISPGNHDLYNVVYRHERLLFYGIKQPENIHIFNSEHFSEYDLGDVSIFGISNTTREIRPFSHHLNLDTSRINIAIFHGSLLSYIPEGKELWLPFKKEELVDSNFDYVALGHYHSYSEITDSEGTVRAAYPGSSTPVQGSETGPRGGLLVSITKQDEKSSVELDFEPLNSIKVTHLSIELSVDHTLEEIRRIIASEVPEHERSKTVLYVKLKGAGFVSFDEIYNGLTEEFLNLEIDTSAVFTENMDILLKTYRADTIIGQFIRSIYKEMEEVNSESAKRILRNALMYGLDAFKGKEIEPRYETKKIQS